MAVIAIYNVKGGVGKTTVAANLAWCSATVSRRSTLLWDLDAAGGGGFLLGIDPRKKRHTGSVIARDAEPARLIRATPYSKLDLLPADESIRGLEAQFAAINKKRRLARLTHRLGKDYERILLDCPPVLGAVSAQIVRAADIVLVPVPPSPLSARAFDLVVREVRENGGGAAILPVLSMLDMRRALHKSTREKYGNWPAIPAASAVEQSAARRQPVGAMAPRAPATMAFKRLWTAVERKLADI